METYIVSTSHRSREKLFRLITARNGYYATNENGFTGENIYSVPIDKLPEIMNIKGIKKFNPTGKELGERISFNNW